MIPDVMREIDENILSVTELVLRDGDHRRWKQISSRQDSIENIAEI